MAIRKRPSKVPSEKRTKGPPRKPRRTKDSRSITLKNVPDALLVQLRLTAEASRRSLNQQAILALQEGLEHQRPSAIDLLDIWRRKHGPIEPDLADAFKDVRDPSPGRDFSFPE